MILAHANQARLIASERFRGHHYGSNHPLRIPRVSLTLDLIRCLDALSTQEFVEARLATMQELCGFHRRAYVDALVRVEQTGQVDSTTRKHFGLGSAENPFFKENFSIPALATGASIQGAQALLAGYTAFAPAGGMHHAMADRARGFCFFNDVVLAIETLRKAGKKVLYVDLDAHHGDGVEQAFDGVEDVFCCSLHMDTDYAYPHQGGRLQKPVGNVLNIPLPRGTDDTAYGLVFVKLVEFIAKHVAMDCIVVQCGTDMLCEDPLGKFSISTSRFLHCVQALLQLAPRTEQGNAAVLCLGGGGYHPVLLARCWTALWMLLSGRELPSALPDTAVNLLQQVEWDDEISESLFQSLYQESVPATGVDVSELLADLSTLSMSNTCHVD